MTDSKKSVKSEKIRRWFEPIGLFLLLAAFGWQCLDEHSKQMQIESYFYETNEKLLAIWEGVYDEALHSDRYHGKTTVVTNYDSLNQIVEDWGQVKKEMSTIDEQSNLFFWIRGVFYTIGSILIISAKWPRTNVLK